MPQTTHKAHCVAVGHCQHGLQATQHTVGTANVRAYCNLLLATGNVGVFGGGANIFRGHCNVQGATDFGLDIGNLPLYYGLVEGAWRHWARVWEVEYDWLQSRFDEVPAIAGRKARSRKENMETPGITSTRWFDAVNLPADQVDQRTGLKAMMVFGHGGNTVTRIPEAVEGMTGEFSWNLYKDKENLRVFPLFPLFHYLSCFPYIHNNVQHRAMVQKYSL